MKNKHKFLPAKRSLGVVWFITLIFTLVVGSFLPGLDVGVREVEAATYTFTEDFTTDTYKDDSETTAEWDTVVGQVDMNASGEMQVTNDADTQGYPDVYDDYVVYQDDRNGNSDIYMYNINSGVETQITTSTSTQNIPRIDDSLIVWKDHRHGNADIYMYNINSGVETQVTTSTEDQYSPDIDSNTVVWLNEDSSVFDVVMYNISTGVETFLTSGTAGGGIFPKVSGDYIVWADFRHGNSDIYMHQISTGTETQLTSDLGVQCDVDIENDNIAWRDESDGVYDIVIYSIISGDVACIGADGFYQINPTINGDTIFWQDARAGFDNWDIYMLYPLPVSSSSMVVDDSPRLVAVTISAHPNPFNSSVRISTPANAMVEIFDTRGRKIDQVSGNTWQPNTEISSGIYFARVASDSGVTSKKLVYMK